MIALLIPAALAMSIILTGGPTFSGPPKDGSGYTLYDHFALVIGALSASVFVSWIMAPLALIFLRAAAMLGLAGWGSAILTAILFGVPFVHIALIGDVTTEENAILPHIIVAIALLGLTVWAAFWSLMKLKSPSTNSNYD